MSKRKTGKHEAFRFFYQSFRLSLLGCINGAGACASTAINAGVSIYNVLAVAF